MNNMPNKSSSIVSKIAPLIVIAVIAGAGYYGYTWYKNDKSNMTEEERRAAVVVEAKDAFSQFMELPEGEPIVAEVSDAEELKKQQPVFFAKAENGDMVVIFPGTNVAFLYSPSKKRVVNVANIVQEGAPTGAPAATPTAPAQN